MINIFMLKITHLSTYRMAIAVKMVENVKITSGKVLVKIW